MLWNYIKIGIRNLSRDKIYSLINIIGLTIGITAFFLIILYVQYELNYDQHIRYPKRMYRCIELQHAEGVGDQHVAMTMGPLGPALVNDFPEIQKMLRIRNAGRIPIIYKDKQFNQDHVVFADPSVFELFNVRLIRGDTSTALNELWSVVISENIAKKYFNSVDEAIGKVITYDDHHLKITGVMEDQPKNTHMHMEMLVSYPSSEEIFPWLKSWGTNALTTYILLAPHTDYKKLQDKFGDFLLKYIEIPPEYRHRMFELYLQPVPDIHLKSGYIKFQINHEMGNVTMIYVLTIIAILIIVIACINFINIAIAKSVRRAKEVGVRKVLGANQNDLIRQFIGESLILTLVSIILAIMLMEILLPSFNRIIDKELYVDYSQNWVFNIGLILLWVMIGLVSGSYPAFYLSRFKPITVLKAGHGKINGGTSLLRKALVVFQFIISITLIFSILVIYSQIRFILNKDLGYNYENVVGIPLYNNNSPEKINLIKNEFLKNPGVLNVAVSSGMNGVSGTQSTIEVDDTTDTRVTVRLGYVDENFFPMMGIPVIEGRNFSKEYALDRNEAIIINESAVDYLGWDDPLGKQFRSIFGDTVYKRKVIGVIRDYHYYSLRSKIEPAVYFYNPEGIHILCVKIQKDKNQETMEFIESVWHDIFPGSPFESRYASESLRNQYTDEHNLFKIFSYFTLLSLIISIMGLYGLTSFIIEQRTKEIGIRKIMGGSVFRIISTLIKEFLLLVLIAGIIASPIAW
ncbi:MAG: ABC transporter permease, partial [Bacteroidetes bacterium]|nr:ABC transporter permease [Bacteroidota bacterium]